MKLKKIRNVGILFSAFIFFLVLFADRKVKKEAENQLYDNTTTIPYNKTAIILGTSKLLKSGKINPYFEYRIQAAVALYKSKKISQIVVSGDNSKKDYNEPEDMKEELVKRGIPINKIHFDYAGFRTLDSIYRMKAIFGQDSFTIISQKFHNERAVYIANSLDLNVIAFNAEDVTIYKDLKTNTREKLARVKMLIDLVLNKKPKFLGDPIDIN